MIIVLLILIFLIVIGIVLYFTVFKKNKKQVIKFSKRNKIEYDNLFYLCDNDMDEFIRQKKTIDGSNFKVQSVTCEGLDNENTLYGKQGIKDDHFLFKKNNNKWKGFLLLNEKILKSLSEFKSYYDSELPFFLSDLSEARRKMSNDFDKGVYYGIESSS